MRVVPIDNLDKVLEELGGSAALDRDLIYISARGMRVRFAGRGVKISRGHVDKINSLGVDYVFLRDPLCDRDINLIIDEDLRVALSVLLNDFLTRCGVVMDIYISERKSSSLDYSFRDYWNRYSNFRFDLLHKYKKNIQDLVYVIRSNYSHRKISPMPLFYNDHTYRIAHPINVAIIAGIIALHYGEFNAERITHLIAGGLLQDVGFVDMAWERTGDVGDNLFFKHSRIGCMIINETETLSPQMGIIALEHHRYMNNTGYPEDIPEKDFYGYPRVMHLYSRIVSVAETFDVLRGIYHPDKVIDAMMELSDSLFEEKAVELLNRHISKFYLGEMVRLSDGHRGIVVSGPKPIDEYEVIIIGRGTERYEKGEAKRVKAKDIFPECLDRHLFDKKLRPLISEELLNKLEGAQI